MEDSSHSTPSPMSSAASSQDSLHRRIHLGNAAENPYGNPYQHLMVGSSPHMSAAQAAAAKKKGKFDIKIVKIKSGKIKLYLKFYKH